MKKTKARNAREQRTTESLKDRCLQTLCLQTPSSKQAAFCAVHLRVFVKCGRGV